MTDRAHAEKKHVHDVARVIIQLTSGLTIGAGGGDDIVDALFVTDANGLPTIPGTSLAGVLRDLWERSGGDQVMATGTLFGHVDELDQTGHASRLVVSWAHIHDSQDRPVAARLSAEAAQADALLRVAAQPMVRQHVRLNDRGVADSDDRGLFDEAVVAAGHRFTFELVTRGMAADVLDHLVALIADKAMRIGGKTRRGMGSFEVVRVQRRTFDLGDPDDFQAYCALPSDLAAPVPPGLLHSQSLSNDHKGAMTSPAVTIGLWLRPRGFWLFGGGAALEEDVQPATGTREARAPDMLPYREPIVLWEDGTGRLASDMPRIMIPATGLKGALRHRARFHAFARAQQYAGAGVQGPPDNGDDVDGLPSVFEDPPEIVELFGAVKTSPNRPSGTVEDDGSHAADVQATAGRVMLSDIVLTEAAPKWLEHVSIDRFTSGPLDGHLFSERALWQLAEEGLLQTTIVVRDPASLSDSARQILQQTLQDLVDGHLQIGAGSGRGHGFMEGKIEWPPWPAARTNEARPEAMG